MDTIFQQSFNAIQLGAVYALIALGYTLVYGVLRLINFAHGDIFMVGGFLGFFLATFFKLPAFVFIPFAMFLTAILGVVIERVAYRKLRHAQRMSLVITTLGVGIFLENFVQWVAGPQTRQLSTAISTEPVLWLQQHNLTITHDKIWIILISLILMLCLWLFVHKTLVGKAMRAVADNKDVVPLMGINVDTIIMITFAIGSALAAAGGIFFGQAYSIDPYVGVEIGWKAFIAAVIGGIGSIEGAVLGSFLLAGIEIFTVAYLSSNMKNGIVFALLVLLLLLCPNGIVGKAAIKKV